MRVIAAVLVTAASVFAGVLVRMDLRRRVRVSSEICLFLREMRLRARLYEPLDVQITALSQDAGLTGLTFLSDCSGRCLSGQPLPQAWTSAVRTFARAQRLPRTTEELLLQCVPALTAADGGRVDGLLEWYETRAAQQLASAAQTDASVGSLCVRVCGAAGLLLGILIL